MANRYWLGTGGDALWSNTNNWSLTDGGAPVGAIPLSTDDVFFTGTSNNPCTINTTNRVAKSLTINGYTNTITFNVNLAVSGSITFTTTGFTLSGSGLLRMIAAGTWTTNGKTVQVPVEIGGTTTFTCTLATALSVSGALTLTNTTSTIFSGAFSISAGSCTISGSQTITLSGDVSITGTTTISDANVINGASFWWYTAGLTVTGNLSGSTAGVYLTGGGTWSGAATVSANLYIDAAGSTISGTVFYNTGTLTNDAYITTGTLSLGGSCSIGGVWNNVTLTAAATLTLNTTLTVSGTLTFPNANVTVNSGSIIVGTFANTAIASSAKTYTFDYNTLGVQITTSNNLTGTSASLTLTLTSNHATEKVGFILGPGASQDMIFVNATRLDSTGGQTCISARGTLTTCFNWLNKPAVNCNLQAASYQIGM